jgi:hypothetical protein
VEKKQSSLNVQLQSSECNTTQESDSNARLNECATDVLWILGAIDPKFVCSSLSYLILEISGEEILDGSSGMSGNTQAKSFFSSLIKDLMVRKGEAFYLSACLNLIGRVICRNRGWPKSRCCGNGFPRKPCRFSVKQVKL